MTRQTEEVLLTAAQHLLARRPADQPPDVALEGGILAVLFLAQFLTPHSVVPRDAFSVMYLVLAVIFLRPAAD